MRTVDYEQTCLQGKAILLFSVKFQKVCSNGEVEESKVKELITGRGLSKIQGNSKRCASFPSPTLGPLRADNIGIL